MLADHTPVMQYSHLDEPEVQLEYYRVFHESKLAEVESRHKARGQDQGHK